MAEGEATDEADWRGIYEQQLPRVFNFFRYRLRIEDDELAQDLTATTFEKAWRARAQFIARATPNSYNAAQNAHENNVVMLTLQQARASLPLTLTRIPALSPNGFVMSGTLLVYKMLSSTSDSIAEIRADYFWQGDAGENLMLAVQAEATAQPITQTTHAQPMRVNGHEATLAELVHRRDWLSLTWQEGSMHYSLLAPRSILSSTLIKMAESTN